MGAINEGAIPISSPIFHPDAYNTLIDVSPAFAKAVILVHEVAGGVPKSYNLPVLTIILFPVKSGLTVNPISSLLPLI